MSSTLDTARRSSYLAHDKHALHREEDTVERLSSGLLAITVLLVAPALAGLAIAEAVEQGSLGPLWQIGWLPAVLVATYAGRRGAVRSCAARAVRRSRP
jgi:hypothetical protein